MTNLYCPICGRELYEEDSEYGVHYHCENKCEPMFTEDEALKQMKTAVVSVEGGDYLVAIEYWKDNKHKVYDVNGDYIGWVYEDEIVRYVDGELEETDL